MDPLDQFEFYKHNRISYFCYLYSFIDGVLLEDYFEKRTVPQAFITTAEILPDIIEGLIYLYNAGINHHDLYPSNIMIQRSFFGRIVGVKIIDFDSISLVEKRHDWQPINTNDEEYRSLNPIQKYESCNGLKKALIEFLNLFVPLKKGENPYAYGYVLTKQAVLGYLDRFKGSPRHISLRVGDIKAVIPAIYYLLKVHYTIQSDPFPCSSPMRALEGLPPRTL
ncbi:hypothetical protein BDF22DRAFT_696312 [Syncephalis plumigaleata]|nr:hypothetical protein BDF22DRAFT_696312 [Syncephalis plumigaleata]